MSDKESTELEQLASAIDELRQQDRIRQLLARYCCALDEYDIDGVAKCFSENAVTDYGSGRGGLVQGRKNIAARIANSQKSFRHTHHQSGQTLINLQGLEADTVSYQITWHELHDGSKELACLRYIDQLKVIDEEWLIVNRRVEVSVVDGFEGTQWNWVQRKNQV